MTALLFFSLMESVQEIHIFLLFLVFIVYIINFNSA